MANFINKLVQHKYAMIILWCSVILIVFAKHNFLSHIHNNYYIFKYTYYHAIEGHTLYGRSPSEYGDKNHYGPLFSLLFAPFALLPDLLGHFLWITLNVLLLLWAIYRLTLSRIQKNIILLICLNELLTAGFNLQFNISIAAIILFTYTLIDREKEWRAPFPMLVGTFVKLYGIVCLAFFFFVKNKWKFILACLVWSALLFILPVILSSPEYVIRSYQEWYQALVIKNSENVSLASYQDVSLMGSVRRVFHNPAIPNFPFILGGLILFALPYLRFSQFKYKAFQLMMVASTSIFAVIFSSSSEGSTYIIAFVGIATWFVIQPKPVSTIHIILLAIAIVLGSFSTTDIYPQFLRDHFFRAYSIKALACSLVWFKVVFEMLTKDFSNYDVPSVLNPSLGSHEKTQRA